jgi:RHS repeat-associated protein
MKVGIETATDSWTAEYYEATVVSAVDYYPFGSAMAGRKYNQGTYRYGFNGKEEDKEWGSQMIQDYGFRIYNPTIGKFLSVDPLTADYAYYTPYQFAGNSPIAAIDLDGLEPFWNFDKWNPLTRQSLWFLAGSNKSRLKNKHRVKYKRDYIDDKYGTVVIGPAFENAVLSALGYDKNTKRVGPNKNKNKGYSIPDAVRKTGVIDGVTEYEAEDMVEVKTVLTKENTLVYKDRTKSQIDNYIAEISTNSAPYKDRMAAGGVIYLVTNGNVTIDPEIIKAATKKNICVFHSQAVINEDGKVAIESPVWLNKKDIDVSKQLINSKKLLEIGFQQVLLNDNGISEKTMTEYIEERGKVLDKQAKNLKSYERKKK